MADFKSKDKCRSQQITDIGVTSDTLTSRGGLALFVRYLSQIGILPELERRFGRLRKSAKGALITELFKQILSFFLDGTSRHLTWFDQLKQDQGYAAGIETAPKDMVSSHAVKRFFMAFPWPMIWVFRHILQQLFAWRLLLAQPDVVVLNIDTMVMDNDEAEKRHGVEPTYKKVKGFKPLQMTWGRYVVDAVFRGGKKHCNHGDTVIKMIVHIAALIRSYYRTGVPIVIRMDSAFFDQKIFEACEFLDIGYVCGGRLTEGVKAHVGRCDWSSFQQYRKANQTWDYLEFGDKPRSWSRFRRAIFCRPEYENRQKLLEFARPDTVIYTNLGMGHRIDGQLKAAGLEGWLMPRKVIELYHGRGRDELVHRALKDFGFEELPFKRFAPNAAFYYVMVLAFFLYEAFKEDVCRGGVAVSAYATTLRRKVIDFAAKIVRSGGKTILKVTAAVWDGLNISELWSRCNHPPAICWD